MRNEETMSKKIHNLFCRVCVFILVAEVLTGCLLTAGCTKRQPQDERTTSKQPAGPKADSRAIQITVLYDNYTLSDEYMPDWGFSCIFTGTQKCILFDTGANENILLDNMDKLKVRAQDVNLVIISHDHPDHTAGLSSFLDRHSNVLAYLPSTASGKLVNKVESRGSKAQKPDRTLQICEGVHIAALAFNNNVKQFLVLDTTEGLVVVTGCAHPGIVEIVKKARQTFFKDVHLVFGGFHLLDLSDSKIKNVIQQLRDLGVRKVGPSHCTGDRAIELFKQEYGDNFVQIGVGRTGITVHKPQ